MDRYELEENAKKGALGALAVVCPPAYVAQKEIREGVYSNGFTRTVGAVLKTGVTAVLCFLGGAIFNIGLCVDSEKTMREEAYERPNINLVLTQKSFRMPTEEILLRGALFPLEGFGRLLTGKYPIDYVTKFSGRIKREDLDYLVEGKIPGIKNSDDLTSGDLGKHVTSVNLDPRSCTNFFRSTN